MGEEYKPSSANRPASLHPGGMTDISRGLRSNATIPPDPNAKRFRIPEGCQTNEIRPTKNVCVKFPRTRTDNASLNRHMTSAPHRLVCHPSGMKNDLSCASLSGGVAFAQPPANFCYPSGIKHGSLVLTPVGVTEISRGLRSASDDTPGSEREAISHPGGMPDDRDSISEKPSAKFPTTRTDNACWNRLITPAPDRLVCHPAGMKNESFLRLAIRGCRYRSTPG